MYIFYLFIQVRNIILHSRGECKTTKFHIFSNDSIINHPYFTMYLPKHIFFFHHYYFHQTSTCRPETLINIPAQPPRSLFINYKTRTFNKTVASCHHTAAAALSLVYIRRASSAAAAATAMIHPTRAYIYIYIYIYRGAPS